LRLRAAIRENPQSVKPAPFDYAAPTTLEEALDILAEHGEDTSVLAGGQSLVALLNLRVARPALVLDVNRIPALDAIDVSGGRVRLGALTRLAALERTASLPRVLHEAIAHVGHPQIRNRTTIGGNLAHADPASELPAVVLALDGEIVLTARGGERTVPAVEFFVGPFATARRPDELVTEVRMSAADGTFVEFARRVGDFALVGACVADGRIALCGASPAPMRAPRAEAALAAGAIAAEVGVAASEEVDPWDDAFATAAYRRDLARTLVRRAVEALAA
jgi:carbon-monoxide dehydrogenase medium subunit